MIISREKAKFIVVRFKMTNQFVPVKNKKFLFDIEKKEILDENFDHDVEVSQLSNTVTLIKIEENRFPCAKALLEVEEINEEDLGIDSFFEVEKITFEDLRSAKNFYEKI